MACSKFVNPTLKLNFPNKLLLKLPATSSSFLKPTSTPLIPTSLKKQPAFTCFCSPKKLPFLPLITPETINAVNSFPSLQVLGFCTYAALYFMTRNGFASALFKCTPDLFEFLKDITSERFKRTIMTCVYGKLFATIYTTYVEGQQEKEKEKAGGVMEKIQTKIDEDAGNVVRLVLPPSMSERTLEIFVQIK